MGGRMLALARSKGVYITVRPGGALKYNHLKNLNKYIKDEK